MSIISGTTVNWGVSPRIITIPQSYGVTVSAEDLLDTLQDIEDSEQGMAFLRLHDASGHETLSSTEQVALTIKLVNAKLEFADRTSPTVCSVTGGNLVAVDANNNAMDAIEFSDNVVVMLKSSSSGTLVESGKRTGIFK